jgi:hypothetical protein
MTRLIALASIILFYQLILYILLGSLALIVLPIVGGLISSLYIIINSIKRQFLSNNDIRLHNIKQKRLQKVLSISVAGFLILLSLNSPILSLNKTVFADVGDNKNVSDSTENQSAKNKKSYKYIGYSYDDELESRKLIKPWWQYSTENKDSDYFIGNPAKFDTDYHLLFSTKTRVIYESFEDSIRKDSIQVYRNDKISIHGFYPFWRIITSCLRETAMGASFTNKSLLADEDGLAILIVLEPAPELFLDLLFRTGEIPLYSDDGDRLTWILNFLFFCSYMVSIIFMIITFSSYILSFVKLHNPIVEAAIRSSHKILFVLFAIMLICLLLLGQVFAMGYGLIFLWIAMLIISRIQIASSE